MEAELEQLRQEIMRELTITANPDDLETVRVKFLGRNGLLPKLLENLKDVPKEDRPLLGRMANEVKSQVSAAFDMKKQLLEQPKADYSTLDLTLPGREPAFGKLHPVYQTIDEIVALFKRMGFVLAEGPDIEREYYNFDALNTPPDHTARNEQDTFYIEQSLGEIERSKIEGKGRSLLRSQTSPVQIRVMEKQQPPVRIISPGACYRRDNPDATHAMMFHQLEGLYVDEGVTLADLKGTMEFFFRELLGPETKVRFRPHFFPFTEPSFEIDFSQPGKLIRGKEWLEIAGCGMVDPNVLGSVHYDTKKYTGFAFGMGIERIAMIRHGVDDIRHFTDNDLRFLRQF
ncbi:MAG: phenylalanine--tRNA ligase subunit alpha [Verrucomicrobiota bacterium]|nr:phenylalanine--tRNA ligase subunit alpha [Verrucomicrobiota bacterium]